MGLTDKRRSLQRGVWSERLAVLALLLRGYRPLARNFRCKAGEIDIIARKGDVIAIVEVKARATVDKAVDAVGYENRQRVMAAADWWLSRRKDFAALSVRYDIVAVVPGRWPVHLKDAF